MSVKKDPKILIKYDHNDSNQLTKLVWMQGEQMDLYLHFCNTVSFFYSHTFGQIPNIGDRD